MEADCQMANQSECRFLTKFTGPEPYLLQEPIPITFKEQEGTVYALFEEANISSGGRTRDEAFEYVEGLILTMYEVLEQEVNNLTAESTRQLNVLRKHLKRMGQDGIIFVRNRSRRH